MKCFATRSLLMTTLVAGIATVGAPVAAQTASIAPTLIPITGQLTTENGEARTGNVLLVISLYEMENDPAPRWIEHQVVTLSPTGRYTVQFGATQADGLPADLFSSATAVRWLGVAVENESEQPRAMLVSVPYAAKAVSADTLNGKAASDFVLLTNLPQEVKAALISNGKAGLSGDESINATGTLNNLQKGDGAGGVKDTVAPLYESDSGNVGIGTANPASITNNLTIEQASASQNVSGLAVKYGSGRSVFFQGGDNASYLYNFGNGGLYFYTNGAVSQTMAMAIKNNGNVGIGTTTPTTRLEVIGAAHITGDITVDGNIAAKYQDVAEWVDSAEPLDAGSIVVIDRSRTNRVTGATRPYDSRVAGAVSAQPGVILGEPGAGRVLVAQSGRVRVKADARYGAIRPGDLLVTSPTKGHAMRSVPVKIGGQQVHRPGTLIGKALESLASGRGEILVLLTLQ